MPWLDHWLAKNPLGKIGPLSFDVAGAFAYQQVMARKADKTRAGAQPDFLNDILEVGGDDMNIILNGVIINVRSYTLLRQAVGRVEVDNNCRS
jgi:hypothetical protein